MEAVIRWWAGNTVAANLLMVGIILAGILGFVNMEREAFPLIKVNNVQVNVAWPGAAPQELEEQVVIRIEEAMKDLEEVDRTYSFASEGFGQVTFRTGSKTDMGEFVAEIKRRVDGISSLPRDIERPIVREQVFRNEMMRVAVHGDIGERALARLAEDLRDEVAGLSNISVVELFGVRQEEVSIELSESAMRRFGVSFDQVARAIGADSINQSSGRVRGESGDVVLRARNLADTEADFSRIIVHQTDAGAIVRIGDVARVVDGFEDNEILATLNGDPAVLIQIMTQENMQVVKASDTLKEWIEEKQKELPPGVGLTLWDDSSDIYKSRMETIGKSATYGLLLVFIVLFLTLRPRVAFWVSVGIGTAYAGSLALLPANDVSMNFFSTFAFLLVLGIVVDDAIVVGESIHHESEAGDGGLDAAVMGTQLVAKPVIFAVLTTMIAFIPWLFLSGEDVQITRQITLVIVLSLTFSLIEALLILPAHLSKLSPKREKSSIRVVQAFYNLQEKIAGSIVNYANTRYRAIAHWCVSNRYITLSGFIAAFMISIGLFSTGWVKFSFMPEIESDSIYILAEMPEGTPYSRSLQILEQLQAAQVQLEEEISASAVEGKTKLIENWYTRARRDNVIAIVQLAPPETRALSAKAAAERLRELIGDIPDAQEIKVNYTLDDSVPSVRYSISHPDMDTLLAASEDLQNKLASYESIYYVRDNMHGSANELHFSLLPGAEKIGLTLREVSRQVRQAYYGEEVQRLPRENGDVKVMVRYPREDRQNLESLSDFRIRLADGRQVPLFAVAEVEVAQGVNRILRREGRRSATVQAYLKGDVREQISKDLDENFFDEWKQRYPGVIMGAIGDAEAEAQFFSELASLYLIAFFIMYWLLAVGFRSYWLPLIVMTAIPFGFMGAVYGHLIFGATMALFSYFGVGAAAGVVVNDNLVLMDYINRLRDQGHSAVDAVVKAGVQRFRPILLTTVTTFVGLVPMMAERSTQAQFLHPTVISLAFGVLFALFVTLLLVPALYCIGDDVSRSIVSLRRRLAGLIMPARAAKADQ